MAQEHDITPFNDQPDMLLRGGGGGGGVTDMPTEVFLQRDKEAVPLHLWDRLLQKLEVFMDNRPSENALLC